MSSKCRSCGAPIIWAITLSGKRIPLDAEQVKPNHYFRLDNGYAVKSKPLYQAHFASCPDADRWRKE